jgi:hypothetical protein
MRAEEEERRKLAAPFEANYRPGHFKTPLPSPIQRNPYYIYFKSTEGDEATARLLLPELRETTNSSPKEERRSSRHRDEKDKVDLTSLKPRTAELFVKLEKLYRKMKKEDTEFENFRKDFFEREKQRRMASANQARL